MNDEIKRIQNLLDKYMDGATSNEEEATLRKYFEEHANDIPEEWESYRALFTMAHHKAILGRKLRR